MLQPFRTERLSINPLQMREAAEVSAVFSSPEVIRWIRLLDPAGLPLKRAKALIATQQQRRRFVLGVRLSDGSLAGILLYKIVSERLVEIGYAFRAEQQGKGYATEALQATLNRMAD